MKITYTGRGGSGDEGREDEDKGGGGKFHGCFFFRDDVRDC